MELMDKSLDQLYKLVHEKLKLTIPEPVIGKMALAVGQQHCGVWCSRVILRSSLPLFLVHSHRPSRLCTT